MARTLPDILRRFRPAVAPVRPGRRCASRPGGGSGSGAGGRVRDARAGGGRRAPAARTGRARRGTSSPAGTEDAARLIAGARGNSMPYGRRRRRRTWRRSTRAGDARGERTGGGRAGEAMRGRTPGGPGRRHRGPGLGDRGCWRPGPNPGRSRRGRRMSAGWVAGSVRGRLLARRRLGRAAPGRWRARRNRCRRGAAGRFGVRTGRDRRHACGRRRRAVGSAASGTSACPGRLAAAARRGSGAGVRRPVRARQHRRSLIARTGGLPEPYRPGCARRGVVPGGGGVDGGGGRGRPSRDRRGATRVRTGGRTPPLRWRSDGRLARRRGAGRVGLGDRGGGIGGGSPASRWAAPYRRSRWPTCDGSSDTTGSEHRSGRPGGPTAAPRRRGCSTESRPRRSVASRGPLVAAGGRDAAATLRRERPGRASPLPRRPDSSPTCGGSGRRSKRRRGARPASEAFDAVA